ncbi:hypothetical protein ABH917_003726 [Thermobifida halotolerans]
MRTVDAVTNGADREHRGPGTPPIVPGPLRLPQSPTP